MAPPCMGFQSRRKQAKAKVDKARQLRSSQDAQEKTAAERDVILRKVQRMPNLPVNDLPRWEKSFSFHRRQKKNNHVVAAERGGTRNETTLLKIYWAERMPVCPTGKIPLLAENSR